MTKVVLAAAIALAAASVNAQSVSFTKVLDTATSVGSSVYSSTYNPVDDKYLVSHATTIDILDGQTGAKESTGLDVSTISPSGLGFFTVVSGEDGYIYAQEDGAKDIWRWSNIADPAPEKVYDSPVGLSRAASIKTELDGTINLAFTGAAGDGNVEFYTDSFPFASGSFQFTESVNLLSKSSIAINRDATVVFNVGDSGFTKPIQKWVKTAGIWGASPEYVISAAGVGGADLGGGPMAYDDTNDILFVLPVSSSTPKKLHAFKGADGSLIGSIDVETATTPLVGYLGAYVEPITNGGTLWMSIRGATSSDAALYKYTYSVDTSDVSDWSLYKP